MAKAKPAKTAAEATKETNQTAPPAVETEEKKADKKVKIDWVTAVGRRKRAVARVRIWLEKNGKITVNSKPIDEYFPSPAAAKKYDEPLRVIDRLGKFGVSIKVSGGGRAGQLGAIVHGMANSLVTFDSSFREPLSKTKLLTRDPREKERRKYGHAGKARARKQSPKR